MLDPRIYRTGLLAVLVAVIVFAFSLKSQQGGLGTTLPPQAFNGQNAYSDMVGLARKFPDVRPGSPADGALAAKVATALHSYGLSVSTTHASARTADGTRTLETVSGSLAGVSGASSTVIVAPRDLSGPNSQTNLSATAVMLELARVLGGQTQHRSVQFVSTSGSAGAAGATQLARTLGTSVNAVIVLGDLASTQVRQPVVVPWSNSQLVAPPVLRNTIAAALASQAGLSAGKPGVAVQFAHLAFPLSLTGQGPIGAAGYPTVLLSLSGERLASDGSPATEDRIAGLGQTVLETVNSLGSGGSIPAPSAYLLLSGEVVPGWAVKLLVAALILPVLLTMIDGLARAKRRGNPIFRWLMWVLAGAVPFFLAALIVLGAKVVGLIGAAPPGPLGAGAVPLGGAGIVVIVLACAAMCLLAVRRPVMAALARLGKPSSQGAGAAVLLVLCVVTIVIWTRNPFAAALLIPALHLWLWVLDPEVPMPRPVLALLVLLGVTPPALVIIYYMQSLGVSPIDAVWNSVLLVAGGYIGLGAAVLWSLVLGCLASVISIAVNRPRAQPSHPEQTPVTVRGPATYAGPGSLGGTESALRR